MANVTDDELDEKRQNVAKLREQITAEEYKSAERLQSKQNEIEAAQLDAEAARLESRLALAKESAKAAAIKEGASGPLADAKQQMQAAQSRANQPVGPVDTNAGKSGNEVKE